MVPETEPEFYLKEAKDMLNITQRLIADGEFKIFPEKGGRGERVKFYLISFF